jgi:hypothetical protein
MWKSIDGRRLLVFLPEGDMSLERANQYESNIFKIYLRLKSTTGKLQINMSYTWHICTAGRE